MTEKMNGDTAFERRKSVYLEFWRGLEDAAPDLDLLAANPWLGTTSSKGNPFLHQVLRMDGGLPVIEAALDLGCVRINERDDDGNSFAQVVSGPTRWRALQGIEGGQLALLKRIKVAGARFDTTNEAGWPCWATSSSLPVAKFMIASGSPLDCYDAQGQSALSEAIRGRLRGDELRELVVLALDGGADPNGLRSSKLSHLPVMAALDVGEVDLAKLLVERGARLDLRDNNGGGLFHSAESPGVVHGLAELGVDLEVLNNRNRTAFMDLLVRTISGLTGGKEAQEPSLIAFVAAGADLQAFDNTQDASPAELIEEHQDDWPRLAAAVRSYEARQQMLDVMGEIDRPKP